MKIKTAQNNPQTAITTKPTKAIFKQETENKFDGKIMSDADMRLGVKRKCKM